MSVRVAIHGGLNEIGGNKILLEDGGDRLFLDFGTPLGSRSDYFAEFINPRTTTALTDLLELGLLPDVDGIYREDLIELAWEELDREPPESGPAYRERTGERAVHGILLTHAHLDHYGDLAYVDPEIPVYCTATTRTMLEAIGDVSKSGIDGEITEIRERRLDELGSGAYFPGDLTVRTTTREREIRTCPVEGAVSVGPFEVTAIPVDHSVPGAVAFHVETPSGASVFYTGDLRFHGRLTDRTETLRAFTEGLEPDLLLSEGTRIRSEAGEDEATIEDDVAALIEDREGLAIVEFGWKDTTRFDTLQRVAERTGRTLVIDPKLALLLRRLAHRQDVPSKAPEHYDNVEVFIGRRDTMRYQPSDYNRAKHEAGYLADWDKKTLQAAWKAEDDVTLRDPLAHLREGVRATDVRERPGDYILHLSFYDAPDLIDLQPPEGSVWIRCLTEPFNEEMELDLRRQENWMERFGLEHNVTEAGGLGPDALTHVSGHASGTELRPFIDAMDADTLVPVHTETDSLPAFEGLADQVVTFPDLDPEDGAAGEAVVEL